MKPNTGNAEWIYMKGFICNQRNQSQSNMLQIPFGSLLKLVGNIPAELDPNTILNLEDDGKHFKALTGQNEIKSFIIKPELPIPKAGNEPG